MIHFSSKMTSLVAVMVAAVVIMSQCVASEQIIRVYVPDKYNYTVAYQQCSNTNIMIEKRDPITKRNKVFFVFTSGAKLLPQAQLKKGTKMDLRQKLKDAGVTLKTFYVATNQKLQLDRRNIDKTMVDERTGNVCVVWNIEWDTFLPGNCSVRHGVICLIPVYQWDNDKAYARQSAATAKTARPAYMATASSDDREGGRDVAPPLGDYDVANIDPYAPQRQTASRSSHFFVLVVVSLVASAWFSSIVTIT